MAIRETYYGKIYPDEWSEFETLKSALNAGSKYVIAEFIDLDWRNSIPTIWGIYDSESQKTNSLKKGKWRLSNIKFGNQSSDYSASFEVIDPIGVKKPKYFKSRSNITAVFEMMMNYLDEASGFLSLKELSLREENSKLKEKNQILEKEILQLRKRLGEN